MSDQENYFNIDYPGYSPLEVTLNDPEDFLKVRETLSRIGVASKKEQVLYQSCHILHKKGRYFITHFKELFALDGKEADFQDNDLQRRNTIAILLQDWNLIDIVNTQAAENKAPLSQIKVLPFKSKARFLINLFLRSCPIIYLISSSNVSNLFGGCFNRSTLISSLAKCPFFINSSVFMIL